MSGLLPCPSPTRREHLVALLLAAALSLCFLHEGLLPGRCIVPFPPEALEPLYHEVLARGERDPAELLVGNRSLGDKYNQSLTWDRISRDGLLGDGIPTWTRSIGGGQPFVPHMGQVYHPLTQLLRFVPAPNIHGWWFLLQQVLFGWTCWLFLRRIHVAQVPALFGLVCAVLGLWMQARFHHNVIVTAALPTFAMLIAVQSLFRGGGPRTAALLGALLGLSWLSGLPQVSLQASWLVLGYALFEAVRSGGTWRRPVAWLLLALMLGAMIGMAQMGPVLSARAITSRLEGTPELLVERAMQCDHLLNALWPGLLHWPSDVFYNGSIDQTRTPWFALWRLDDEAIRNGFFNWSETAFSIGIAGLLLALYGACARPGRHAIFFTIVLVIGLLFATASEPVLSLSGLVPGARAGDFKRFLFLAAVALPVLAALGADRVFTHATSRDRSEDPQDNVASPGNHPPRRPLFLMVATTLVLCISLASTVFHLRPKAEIETFYAERSVAALEQRTGIQLPVAAFHAAVHRGPAGDEAEANRNRLLRTFVISSCAAALLLAVLLLRRRRFALPTLLLVNAVELLLVGQGPLVVVESERVTTPPVVLAKLLLADHIAQKEGHPRPRFQRLFAEGETRKQPLLPPNLGAFYGVEDLAGYCPLPPARFEQFFEAIEPGISLSGAGVGGFQKAASLDHPLLDVLGLRFVLTAYALDPDTQKALRLVDRTEQPDGVPHRLYERIGSAPRSRFLPDAAVEVIADQTTRLARLADRTRDAQNTVIVEDPSFVPQSATDASGTSEIVMHSDMVVIVDVDCNAPGILRLADPYDAGWTATIGDAQTEVFPVDHWLRGVRVPAGQHRIAFRHDGASVRWPVLIASAGLLGTVLLFGFGTFQAIRRRTNR